MRLGYQDAEASRIQFRDELETLKYSVDRAASDLESSRAQSKELTREIKDKRTKYDSNRVLYNVATLPPLYVQYNINLCNHVLYTADLKLFTSSENCCSKS